MKPPVFYHCKSLFSHAPHKTVFRLPVLNLSALLSASFEYSIIIISRALLQTHVFFWIHTNIYFWFRGCSSTNNIQEFSALVPPRCFDFQPPKTQQKRITFRIVDISSYRYQWNNPNARLLIHVWSNNQYNHYIKTLPIYFHAYLDCILFLLTLEM